MIAGVALTLAAVQIMVLLHEWRRASIAFVVAACSVVMFAGFELYFMRAPSPEAFATAMRWIHVPSWTMTIALIVFVRDVFPEQRTWLALATASARTLILAIDFLGDGQNFNFDRVTALQHIDFLGDTIAVPVGIRGHWDWIALVERALFSAYVVDAAIRHARTGPGARPRALVIGGGMVLFVVGSKLLVELVNREVLALPYMVSISFLGVTAVMAWELSRDVLRSTRLSRELGDSERRGELAASAARAGLWRWQRGERLMWADSAARALHAVVNEGARGELGHYLSRIDASDREHLRKLFEPGANTEFEVEYRVLLPEGGVRWLRSRGAIERDAQGRAAVVQGGSIDVTDWRDADLRFRGVVEAAPAALFVVDGEGTILLANHRAEEMFRAGREMLVGQLVTDLAAIGKPRRSEWARNVGLNERRARRLDGSEFTVEVGISEIPAPGGSQFLASMVDATQRLEHEREMQKLREQFASASRISLAGQLASTLAHELSQPLAAILRNAETAGILLERKEPDLAQLEAILDDIRSDDRRAADIIEHMRSLLRGRGPQLAPVSLPELLRRVASVVRHDAELRDVKVTVEAGANVPDVLADSTQLQQVLLNLVYNSLHALEVVAPKVRHVGLHARLVQDHVEIAVSDTGPGIASAALPRIFDAFFSTKTDGMGMGLAICRSLVDAMGGSIEARNAMGGGAVFRIALRPAEVTA